MVKCCRTPGVFLSLNGPSRASRGRTMWGRDGLCQPLRWLHPEAVWGPSASHEEKHETCGFCAISVHPHLSCRPGSWGIWTRQEQSPGPARQEHQWGRSISGTRTRPDLQYWSSFEGHDIHQDPAANSGTGCQPCPLHVSVDTRLLRPTQQPLAKPTPDINNLMGKTFLN